MRRVIEPLLTGAGDNRSSSRDLEYVRDIGLIAREDPPRIANPIYAEVVPRELTYAVQATLNQDAAWYVGADDALDMDKLLTAFQAFFREHSEHWVERFDYREAGPQLLLQAMMEGDREDLCGPKGRHQVERPAWRGGSAASQVTLGGRQVGVPRLRVRSAAGEVPLPSFQWAAATDPLAAVAAGASTRRYAGTLDPTPAEVAKRGTLSSAVSRRFVALSAKRLRSFLSRPLGELDLRVVCIRRQGVPGPPIDDLGAETGSPPLASSNNERDKSRGFGARRQVSLFPVAGVGARRAPAWPMLTAAGTNAPAVVDQLAL